MSKKKKPSFGPGTHGDFSYLQKMSPTTPGSDPDRKGHKKQHNANTYVSQFSFIFIACKPPGGRWADPGGTAIPGQPVVKAEQAPDTSPRSKNQFNIEGIIRSRIRY